MTDAEVMLEDCMTHYHKLNDWQRGFINSINEIDDIGNMSFGQYKKLEKIWEKIT